MSYTYLCPSVTTGQLTPDEIFPPTYSSTNSGFAYAVNGAEHQTRSQTPLSKLPPSNPRDYNQHEMGHSWPPVHPQHYSSLNPHQYSSLESQAAGSQRAPTSYPYMNGQDAAAGMSQHAYNAMPPMPQPAKHYDYSDASTAVSSRRTDAVAESWTEFRNFIIKIEPVLYNWFLHGKEKYSTAWLEKQLHLFLSKPLELDYWPAPPHGQDCSRPFTPVRPRPMDERTPSRMDPRLGTVPPPGPSNRDMSNMRNRPPSSGNPLQDLMDHNQQTLNMMSGGANPSSGADLADGRPRTPSRRAETSPPRSVTPAPPPPAGTATARTMMIADGLKPSRAVEVISLYSSPELHVEYCKELYTEKERNDFFRTISGCWKPFEDGELPGHFTISTPPLICSVVRCLNKPSWEVKVSPEKRDDFDAYINFIIRRLAKCLDRDVGDCLLLCAEKSSEVAEQSWQMNPAMAVTAVGIWVLQSTGKLDLHVGRGGIQLTPSEGSLVILRGERDAVMDPEYTIRCKQGQYSLVRFLFQ